MKIKFYILTIILISAFGCSKDDVEMENKNTVVLNEIFDLKIEEEVLFEEGDLCVKFTKVVEDNRCPEPVDCILAGRVWIELEITENNIISTIDLISEHSPFTDSLSKIVAIGDFEIEFYEVKPEASLSVELEDEDYTISLRIKNPSLSVCEESLSIDNVAYDTINTQNYSITTVGINGDCLNITINASGCDSENWVANLIDSADIAESSPEQRYVKLELINEEICTANFDQSYTFNISSLQTSNDVIIINLQGWNDFIYYEYN